MDVGASGFRPKRHLKSPFVREFSRDSMVRNENVMENEVPNSTTQNTKLKFARSEHTSSSHDAIQSDDSAEVPETSNWKPRLGRYISQ
jgi:hypothetical protein